MNVDTILRLRSATKVIKSRLGLLNLAEELGNVSLACKYLGYSRDTFYRYRELVSEGGEGALREMSRKKPNIKNRIEAQIEERVVVFAIDNPSFGQTRASN
jgi:ACT domain-containing protein